MKWSLALFLILCLCEIGFTKSLQTSPVRKSWKPSQATIEITGDKAEALFRATLKSDDSLVDYCTAHTCHFTSKCEYNQFVDKADQKYKCTIIP